MAIEDKISRVQDKIRAADIKLETTAAQVELATSAMAEEKEKSRPLIDEHRQLKDTFDTDRRELNDIVVSSNTFFVGYYMSFNLQVARNVTLLTPTASTKASEVGSRCY